MLRASGIKVLERLPIRFGFWCRADELDGQVRGQRAVVLDVGETGGRGLLLSVTGGGLKEFEEVGESVDAG